MLSFNRFTVVQANQPVSIRATYGPFSTKQTVPARYIVPEETESVGEQIQVGVFLFPRLHKPLILVELNFNCVNVHNAYKTYNTTRLKQLSPHSKCSGLYFVLINKPYV